jgi:hypothetical protein
MAWNRREAATALLAALAALAGAATTATAQDASEAPPPVDETGEVRAEIRWTVGYQEVLLAGTGGPPLLNPTESSRTCTGYVQESIPPIYNVVCSIPEDLRCQDASVDAAVAGARLGGVVASARCGGGAAEASCSADPLGSTSARAMTGCQDESPGTGEDHFRCRASPRGLASPYGSVTCRTTFVRT